MAFIWEECVDQMLQKLLLRCEVATRPLRVNLDKRHLAVTLTKSPIPTQMHICGGTDGTGLAIGPSAQCMRLSAAGSLATCMSSNMDTAA